MGTLQHENCPEIYRSLAAKERGIRICATKQSFSGHIFRQAIDGKRLQPRIEPHKLSPDARQFRLFSGTDVRSETGPPQARRFA